MVSTPALVTAKENTQGALGVMVEVVEDPSPVGEEEAGVVMEDALKTRTTSNVFSVRGSSM